MKCKLAILLLSAMIAQIALTQAASPFFVDTPDHWAESQILVWSDRGVLNGYGEHFFPENSISRAEMATIFARLMNYLPPNNVPNTFSDLPEDWYTKNILSCVKAGVIKGDEAGTIRPEDFITRQESAVLFCRALGLAPANLETNFRDNNDISSFARPYVYALVRAGIISGTPEGTFEPFAPITRAETVAMLDKAVGSVFSASSSFDGASWDKSVVISSNNVTITNVTQSRNMIISEGVANGDVWLENVNISGKLIIRGGGINSVHVVNSSINSVEINRADGPVSLKIESGDIGDINIESTDAKLKIGEDAVVSEVFVKNPSSIENRGSIVNFEVLSVDVFFAGNQPKSKNGDYNTIQLQSAEDTPESTKAPSGGSPVVQSPNNTPESTLPNTPSGTPTTTPFPTAAPEATATPTQLATPTAAPTPTEVPETTDISLPSAKDVEMPTLTYGELIEIVPSLDQSLAINIDYTATWQHLSNGVWTDCSVPFNVLGSNYRVEYRGLGDYVDCEPVVSLVIRPENITPGYAVTIRDVLQSELEIKNGQTYLPKSAVNITWDLANGDKPDSDVFIGEFVLIGSNVAIGYVINYSGPNSDFYNSVYIISTVKIVAATDENPMPSASQLAFELIKCAVSSDAPKFFCGSYVLK